MDDWPENEGRVARRDIEGGFLLFDEIPCCAFGELEEESGI